MNTVDIKQKRARFILISLFVFTILFIAGVGYNAYWRYANLHWDNLLTQMDNVASLKSNALVNWRGNHIANAELIRQNSGFAEHIQEYLADPQDEIASNHIHYWVTSYQQQPESNHVWLLDSIGTTLLMESQPAAPIPQVIRSEIPTILQSHNIMFVDFYENEYSQTTQLALLIPILAPDNNNNLVSIMTIEINPQVFLFPYLQDWPIATPTAQTWLVRHEGQNALGRNARQPWIEERYALLNTNVPAVMAVLGETGSVTGQDGHGTDVIADIHTIPDSPWYLITQIEAASANAPLTTRLREIAGICLAAVGVVATTLFIVWRELYLRGYRQQTRMALALHQAESRWQFALEGAGDGVWDWNAITHKVFYSRQWKTMLGFAEEEIGDTLDEWQTRVHPDDLPYVLAEIEQHFAGQTPVYTSEHRLRAKDGTYRWVLDRGKVVEWDENHKPLRVIGTHADMTLPKQTESLITAQRDLARALSTTYSEAEILSLCLAKVLQVTAMDCGGIYLFDDNEQVLELVFHQGLSEAFVQATSRFTVDSPQMQLIRSRQTIYRHAEAMSQNDLYRAEGLYAAAIVPILHQNKVFGCINVASHTLTDIADHTRHALETVALEIGNIVVYQRAAVLLQASEEKYRSLVNSQDAAISTIDANGTFHYINHIGAEPFQLNPEEIVGHHLHDFFPPHIADWQLDRVRQVIKSGQGIRHEYRTILAHNPRWRHVSIQPIHNAAGTVTLAMVNSVDITTQKQLEYDLQEAQARLIEAQELAHLGSWEWNIQKEALTWSEGVYPIFGVDPAHFTPSVDTFENAIYPEDKEAFLQQRTTMLAEKQFAVIDHRIVLPDGQIRYVQERTRLIQNDTGAVIRVIGTVQDITEAKSAESALRASEERYRFIADYVDDIVWQLDTDLRFVYASPATERVLGYLPQEIQGFEVSRLLSETSMAQMYATIQARLSGGSEAHKLTEYKMRHKDGHWIDTEVLSSPVFNASGHLTGFVGVTRDITERKQAETALRLSNQLLHESQAIANLGSWTADLQTGTFDASPEGARLVGWATGVHTTDELLLAIHPDDRTFMRTQWAAAMQGKPYDIEHRVIVGGETRWIHVKARVDFDAAGQPLTALGITQDITERKQGEKRLQENEERLRLSLYAANQGLYDLNVQTGETVVNRQYAEMLGYDPDHFVETHQAWLNRLHPEDEAITAQVYRDYVAGKLPEYRVEFRQRTQQGTWKWILSVGKIVEYDAEGKPLRMLGTHTDITERKQMEESLRKSEALLQEAQRIGRIGHMEWTAPDKHLVCSDEIYRIFELAPGTPLSQYSISQMMTAEEQAYLQQLDQALFAQREDLNYEYRITLPSGRERWLHQQGKVTYGEDGLPNRMIAIVQDITERKHNEEALRESETRAQAMLQAIPDLMFRLNQEAVFLDYKADINDLYAQQDAPLIGKRNRDIAPAEFADLLDEKIQTTLETGKLQTFEYQLPIPSHGLHTYEARMAPAKHNEVVAVVRDITERKQAEEQLQESQLRLELALHGAGAGMWDWNVQTGETVFNDRWAEIVGYTLAELTPITIQTWADLCHPDDLVLSNTLLQNHFAGKTETYECEIRMKHHNGSWVWVSDRGRVVEWSAEGKPLRMSGTHIDVTERKLAEEALRASEEKYRGLMESLDSVVATVDETGRFLYMNDRAAAQLNGTPADFVGKTMHDLFPEPVSTRQLESIRRAIREDRGILSETQTIIQGEYRWNRTIIQPIHDNTGKVIYALINATDIHRLKQIQQELLELNHTLEERVRERTAEVRDLYDHAPNGYHSVDKKGIFVMMNQTELDWLGYTREEIVGQKSAQDLLAPTSRHIYAEAFPRLKQEGLIKDLEFEMVRKDGTLLPVLLNAIAIYDEQGAFLHSRSTILDITERRKTLQVLQESRDELRIANELLEKAAQMKDEFLANMSHELRTPLNAILTFSESLLEEIPGPLNDRQKSWVQNIANSGEHLLSLINDILDLSKVEAGQMELYLEPVSIGDVCQSSLLFVKQIALKKSLKIEYHLENPLDDVDMDQRRLKQILVNLLTNAVKFTQPGGKVSLRVKVDEEVGALYFMVDDTGIGIAAADLERLFQPFTQLDSRLNRQHQGTGLGLALVRRLAELHGGSVTVESELGVGSRFTVALPYQSSKERGRQTAITPPTPTPPSLPLPGGHILLAEDNEVNLVALTDFLKSRHYEVAIARNGREAITIAETIHPSVILMDIQMPELDGLEAIRQLRHMSAFQDTPIVALTALAMPGDRERCLAAGADEYLTKPVSLKVLHGLIQQLIR